MRHTEQKRREAKTEKSDDTENATLSMSWTESATAFHKTVDDHSLSFYSKSN